jgi:hypothetical protein
MDVQATALRSKSKIGYYPLTDTKCLVLEKRDKLYAINNLSTQSYTEHNILQIEIPKTGKFLDTSKSYFKIRVKYDGCNDAMALVNNDQGFTVGITIRTIMDAFKDVKIYHKSNTLLFHDDQFNKHWLHDIAASTPADKYVKIQKQGFGYNCIETSTFSQKYSEIPCNVMPRYNQFTKDWYNPLFDSIYNQYIEPWDEGQGNADDPSSWNVPEFKTATPLTDAEVEIITKIQSMLKFNSNIPKIQERAYCIVDNVKKNDSILNHVTYYGTKIDDGQGNLITYQPVYEYNIPLNWIPFFKSIDNSLLAPHISDNLRIEITLESNELFLASLTDVKLLESQKLTYEIHPQFLSLREIQFTPYIDQVVDKQSNTVGLNWYFNNTVNKYVHNVLNDVDITLNLPLSSLISAKAIPFHTKLLLDKSLFQTPTVNINEPLYIDDGGTQQNCQDISIADIKAFNAISFNSNVSCKFEREFWELNYTNLITNDVLFKKWRFQLGFKSFTTDEVNDTLCNNPINTYNELLNAYDHKHQTIPITFEDFSMGSLYQAVCNFERDPYYKNTGYQCDRDYPLNFRASFVQTLPNTIEKSVFLFVTHLQTAIFVGDKVVIKT